MKAQLLALLTAMAWGIGGYFEKKGLHQGHLSPQVGITLRTVTALIVLAAVSLPQWKTIPQAGALMGVAFGGEALTARIAMGMLLTIGGVALLTVG